MRPGFERVGLGVDKHLIVFVFGIPRRIRFRVARQCEHDRFGTVSNAKCDRYRPIVDSNVLAIDPVG